MWGFIYSYHLWLQLWNSPKDPVRSKPSINCQGVRSRMQARWKRLCLRKRGGGVNLRAHPLTHQLTYQSATSTHRQIL